MSFTPVIVVHGGAGAHSLILHDQVGKNIVEKGVKNAAKNGYKILLSDGTAVDAVQAAVMTLEEDETFNAGKGSCLTATEGVEMDASIMDGSTMKAGGVACIENVAYPVQVARAVMDKTGHCMLVGTQALSFAEKQGIPKVPTEHLVTEKNVIRFNQFNRDYEKSLRLEFNERQLQNEELQGNGEDHDTVGAVALDKNGNVAYATSTGGINAKMPGRCGDSPIIGSAGYACNGVGDTSTTGHGESLMKACIGMQTHMRMSQGIHPQTALEESLAFMAEKIKGLGGAIALNMKGDIGVHFTTDGLAWASIKDKELHYGIYRGEKSLEKLE